MGSKVDFTNEQKREEITAIYDLLNEKFKIGNGNMDAYIFLDGLECYSRSKLLSILKYGRV